MANNLLLYLCIILSFCMWYEQVVAEVKNMRMLVSKTCGEMDCFFNETISCTEKCGCDKSIPYRFNITTGECVLNLKTLMLSLAEKYKTQERNRKRTESIFQGVMASGIIVVTWASLCLISACFYCCRIRYTDHRLRKSLKVIAKKYKAHQIEHNKRRRDEKSEDIRSKSAREETSVV